MSARTRRAIARLAAAWPRVEMGIATVDAWLWALGDLPEQDVDAAVAWAIRTQVYPPQPAELRHWIAERRLKLPGVGVGVELVDRYVSQPATVACPDCEHGQIRDSDAWADCPRCDGTGEVPNARRVRLPEPLARALAVVGGPSGWRSSERPDALRRELARVYEEFRAEAVAEIVLGDPEIAASATRELPSGT